MTSIDPGQRTKAGNEKSDPSEKTGRNARAKDERSTRSSSARSRGAKAGAEAGGRSAPNAAAEPALGWSFREFLVPYILLALSAERAHGYVIEQYLRGIGLVNVELSTLYRTLRQLEKDGLVCSVWEPGPEGPARRIYSLTDTGRWWLDAGAAALEGYRTLIDRFFGNYTGKRTTNHD